MIKLNLKKDMCVFSDLHLGHPRANREDILTLLEKDYEFYVLNGDVIDCYSYKNLTALDLAILKKLEAMGAEDKLVRVEGNHEIWTPALPKLFELPSVHKFEWEINGCPFVALHGHSLKKMFGRTIYSEAAVTYAQKYGYTTICIGHNHSKDIKVINGIVYANSGSFLGYGEYIRITPEPMVILEDMFVQRFDINRLPLIEFNVPFMNCSTVQFANSFSI